MLMKKTMKTMFRAACLLLMATLMCAPMTSCDDDNNEGQESTENHGEIKKGVTTVTVIPSADALKYCEMTMEYCDANGEVHTETIDKSLWLAAITTDALPEDGQVVIKQKAKAGVQLTQDTYNIGATVVLVFAGKYADGTLSGASDLKLGRNHIEQGLTKDSFNKYLTENPVFYSTKFTISKRADNTSVNVTEKK